VGGAEVTVPGAIPGARRVLRSVLGQATMLLAVSEFTAAAAASQAGGKVPARVLRPPIKVGDFAPPSPEERDEARTRLGVRGNLILCVGRLVPRKGQDMLVEAMPRLAAEFPGLELALVGEGRMAGSLFRRAQRAGVVERVRLTGPVDSEGLRTWLHAADVFASPCRTRWRGHEVEGFGIVFAEAALCGLPVVAGLSGGAPESVLDGESGYVIDGRDVDAVADVLRRLLRLTDQQRRQMGSRGRDLALSRHAPDLVAERYHQLLLEAASR
jgi:phosphatidylinositol alpha-1,6-mannosyltransferase